MLIMTHLPKANRPDLTSWCPCWSMWPQDRDLWFGLSNLLIVFTSGTLLHLSFHDTCQLVRLFLQLTGQLICFCRVSVRPLVGLCSLLWARAVGARGPCEVSCSVDSPLVLFWLLSTPKRVPFVCQGHRANGHCLTDG